MKRFSYAAIALSLALTVLAERAHAFGDKPYRLNWIHEPEIQSGCWKWNWQQHGWDDYCPRYIQPKAFMYRSRVLRTRG